jgi:hypothetical protein
MKLAPLFKYFLTACDIVHFFFTRGMHKIMYISYFYFYKQPDIKRRIKKYKCSKRISFMDPKARFE